MARIRVSTTVDDHLLAEARRVSAATSDASLLDQALGALLAQHRDAEIDSAYAAYDTHPLDEPDEWGDLASFRAAASSSGGISRVAASCGGASCRTSVDAPSSC
jgi:hypothetical protein